MARPRLRFSAEQQQRIVGAVRKLGIAFPYDDTMFLGEVIETVQTVVRRAYSVQRYVQWLGEAGVRRRPSNTTLQKTVDRAQGRRPATAGAVAGAVEPRPPPLAHAETGALSTREEQNRIASRITSTPGADVEWMGIRICAEVTERALEHKAIRNRQLQVAVTGLRRRLGEVLITTPTVPPKLTDVTLERLEQIIEAVTRLEGTANVPTGMEHSPRSRSDTVRQQTQDEADQLRQHIYTLEVEVAHLNTQVDIYRHTPKRIVLISHGWVEPSS